MNKKPTKVILNKVVFYRGMEGTDIETWILWMYFDLVLTLELGKFFGDSKTKLSQH